MRRRWPARRDRSKFENLAPGRYSLTAEFSGFQTRTLPEVRVRSGENKQVVVLPLDRLLSSVTVERDKQTAASDRDITFGTVLTREQIDALSDDPDELRRQLMDIAGPRRQDPGRQLRRPRSAAEGADQVDPRHARSVRPGSALRGRVPH